MGRQRQPEVVQGALDLPSVPRAFLHIQQIEPIPCEQGLRWKDIGDANMEESFLYPRKSNDPPCPVPKQQAMSKEDQQKYTQWIENILDID